ncbi:MAG: 3-isopropylmalate dehydratase small subunit [Candidatus Methylomirabilota bacterium]
MGSLIRRGTAVLLRMDDVSTDHIYPAKYINLTDPARIAEHALEGADPTLRTRLASVGGILVTGHNFGCGSSREHAVITLQGAGVTAVIAGSAARIWYRNAINLALPVLVCPEAADRVAEGDALEIDFLTGRIRDLTQGALLQGQAVSEFVAELIARGGIKPMMREKHAVGGRL